MLALAYVERPYGARAALPDRKMNSAERSRVVLTRLPQFSRRAVVGCIVLSARCAPTIHLSEVEAAFQFSGTPSRSSLNSDLRARSKPVTNAAPSLNGDALPESL